MDRHIDHFMDRTRGAWLPRLLPAFLAVATGALLIIPVFFRIGMLHAAVESDLKITLTTEAAFFDRTGKGDQEDIAVSAQVKPDLGVRMSDSWYAVIAPRLRGGLTDPEYNLFSPDEIYLEFVADRFEARIGYQTFFWGTVESFNIVDILNQEDFKGDFLDPGKIGEPAIRTRLLIGENRLDLYLFPFFTPAPLPGKANRFNFFDGAIEPSDDPVYTSGTERLRQQAGLRWERSVGPSDVGLSYFNGYEKFPTLNLPPGGPEAVPVYYEMQQIGADLQMSLGDWMIKGEALYQNTAIAGSIVLNTLLPDGGVALRDHVPDHRYAFVGGVEYTLFAILKKSDLGLMAEYLYDSEQDLKAVAFRPFQNDLFVGMRWTRNNPGDGKLLGGVLVDLTNGSQLWRIEYTERFFDRIKVKATLDVIEAAAEDPTAVFNNDDRFLVGLSYTY